MFPQKTKPTAFWQWVYVMLIFWI